MRAHRSRCVLPRSGSAVGGLCTVGAWMRVGVLVRVEAVFQWCPGRGWLCVLVLWACAGQGGVCSALCELLRSSGVSVGEGVRVWRVAPVALVW